ncbi:hypothetical protein [Oryzicola mucosus]|uniref:Uncharacterized protein n=1 Tax=Oryzicola mucosus TaxID=2767425 RepID=A0A8J6U0J5_9HYPH|nr:hypothetical protein [Oryzicola mucosus]MBD0415751.1 hypothetical protein [Oryzicola mucosus]
MDFIDIYLSQLADPFRIGMLVFLLITAANTAHATRHRWLPIVLGIVFVAVLIPATLDRSEDIAMVAAVGIGLLANLTVVAALLLLQAGYRRLAK